jgi:tetratricopeptide (TPR) repeat protein
MTVKRTTIAKGLLGMAAASLMAGCGTQQAPVSPSGPSRIVMFDASINGRPVRLALDTGAASTVLYNETAKRAGLTFGPPQHGIAAGEFEIVTEMSSPALVKIGAQSFDARLPVFTLPASAATREDGVVGWPEIRNSLLLFDAKTRSIRNLERLPSKMNGWTKLRILPHDTLLMEIPMTDGKTGCLLVDTGAPLGLQLPEALWQEFKASHLDSHIQPVNHSSWTAGSFRAEALRADEFNLGPLHFSGIDVERLSPQESACLRNVAAGDEIAGVMGMEALAQVDLIVDNKNAAAWTRSQPAPSNNNAPAYSARVQLTADNLYLRSGLDYASAGKFPEAISEYSRSCQLNSNNPEIYIGRAVARQMEGDFDGAIHDYDQVIALNSNDSVVARLHRQTLLRLLGRVDENFAGAVNSWPDGWTKTIGLFLSNQLDEKRLLEEAKTTSQQCEVFYYIACKELADGHPQSAREYFQKCAATGVKEYTEYQFATAELRRPASPSTH